VILLFNAGVDCGWSTVNLFLFRKAGRRLDAEGNERTEYTSGLATYYIGNDRFRE
jgi:hypothetical protein